MWGSCIHPWDGVHTSWRRRPEAQSMSNMARIPKLEPDEAREKGKQAGHRWTWMGQVGLGNLRGPCRLSKMGSTTRRSNIGKVYNSDSGVRREPSDQRTSGLHAKCQQSANVSKYFAAFSRQVVWSTSWDPCAAASCRDVYKHLPGPMVYPRIEQRCLERSESVSILLLFSISHSANKTPRTIKTRN